MRSLPDSATALRLFTLARKETEAWNRLVVDGIQIHDMVTSRIDNYPALIFTGREMMRGRTPNINEKVRITIEFLKEPEPE